jgi:hypothetical protein
MKRRLAPPRTAENYARVFQTERARVYPVVDAFEKEMGFALNREKLESAASVLACPVKINPPCWQHGRIVYSAARAYIARTGPDTGFFLDIGTAKGFSALCAAWAIEDAGLGGVTGAAVISLDVLPVNEPVERNSIAELAGAQTLNEFVAPWWPREVKRTFLQYTGVNWLQLSKGRIGFAFVDGKHSFEAVIEEARLLSDRQKTGDVVIFDDLQMTGVRKAVGRVPEFGYDLRLIKICPERIYGYAVKQ